jgi:hypothetical protein
MQRCRISERHVVVREQCIKNLDTEFNPCPLRAWIPGEFIACLEWQRTASDRVRRDLQARRRHFFNKRISMVNYLTPEARPEEMLVDDSANATVRQLGDALTELEVNGHFFGMGSLTLVLHGEDGRALEHQAARARA